MPEVRLIDANVLLKKCIEGDGDNEFTKGYNFAVQEISAYITLAPTIEPEVRHGRWMYDHNGIFVCTVCGYPRQIGASDFCGKCGARMDADGINVLTKDGVLTMQNESWFTDNFNQCDNCPDWDNKKGCKSHGKGCEDGGADNE